MGTKCCLLIDDDLDDQELFCLAAKEADMDVVCICANNGLEGLEKLAQPQAIIPDYIFIDLNMPRMNGIDSLREIQKTTVSKRITNNNIFHIDRRKIAN